MGLETGAALSEGTVENEAKTSTVTVPIHGILRIRPKLQATVEIFRGSITGSFIPRYMAVTETVGDGVEGVDPTTGSATEVAQLKDVKGWQRYGELNLQIALDRSGHIALSTVYKRGASPPTYENVNTVRLA